MKIRLTSTSSAVDLVAFSERERNLVLEILVVLGIRSFPDSERPLGLTTRILGASLPPASRHLAGSAEGWAKALKQSPKQCKALFNVRNGKTVTTTKTTITNSDGTKDVTETTTEGGKTTEKKYCLTGGEKETQKQKYYLVR